MRLDWTKPGHYDAEKALPCRICGTPTHTRDYGGLPCDQACAQDEIAREVIGRASAVIPDERMPNAGQINGWMD
ncbi:hypothetical protein [Polymorphospora sp. NPDC050346]|uniref:hypothetical protein n=1 Tax=Polymorphospora sp. NPDC050346 TaxID=3155780 RepID=UPI0033FEFF60